MNDPELRRWALEHVHDIFPYDSVETRIIKAQAIYQYVRQGKDYADGVTQAQPS